MHASQQVFSCFPRDRPLLAASYFSRFLVSDGYVSAMGGAAQAAREIARFEGHGGPPSNANGGALAANEYEGDRSAGKGVLAAYEPQSIDARLRLCEGVLAGSDLRGMILERGQALSALPMIVVQGTENSLLPAGITVEGLVADRP